MAEKSQLRQPVPLASLDTKITPEMAIFIQLDELNGRLAKLTDVMDRMQARGIRTNKLVSVTDTPARIAFPAIAYSISNDGPNTIYTNDLSPDFPALINEAGLESGESEAIDLKSRQMVEFWIVTVAGGAATVRLRILL